MKTKRYIALLVALTMSVNMLGVTAFADDTTAADTKATEQQVTVQDEETSPEGEETPPEGEPGKTPPVEQPEEEPAGLTTEQQAFAEAVRALDKEALLALAEAYMANPNAETGDAMDAAYLGMTDAEALYAALTADEQAEETVAASHAALQEMKTEVDAALAAEPMLLGTAANVSYLDASGAPQTATSCTVVESSTTYTTWSAGWYVVNSNVTVSQRITVSGDVHLILADGCTLTATKGIKVEAPDSLTIYGQTGGTGTLDADSDYYGACIGGNSGKGAGAITINGGTVKTIYTGAGAGIGSGYGGKGGTIIINGGTVTAQSGAYAAGIGGGDQGGSVDSITITGGTVTASCVKNSATTTSPAAIGGGGNLFSSNSGGDGGIITISGGTVTTIQRSTSGTGTPGTGIIGAAAGGNPGTFTTTATGTALISTGSITGTTDKDAWSGIIYDTTNAGKVYGNQTLNNVTLPTKTLTVPAGTTLTVGDSVTLPSGGGVIQNEGTITGTLTKNGTVKYLVTASGDSHVSGFELSTTGAGYTAYSSEADNYGTSGSKLYVKATFPDGYGIDKWGDSSTANPYEVPATNINPVTLVATSKVVKTKVPVPTIPASTYTERNQTATVPASSYYTVTTNNGGEKVGSYDVVLTLTNPTTSEWDSGDDNKDGVITLPFVINPMDITKETVTVKDFKGADNKSLAYTGAEQTPQAQVWNDNAVQFTGSWSKVTNVGEVTTFTATGNFTGTITRDPGMAKKDVSVGFTGTATKVYDGNTTVTDPNLKVTLSNAVEGDDVSATASLTYEDANVGESKGITAGNYSLQGTKAGNYSIGGSTGVASGPLYKITPATLTDVSVTQNGTLTYTGAAQTAAVTPAATAVNSQSVTFTYCTTPTGTYSTTVPAFTEVGDYTVYYKASAPNHNTTDAASFTVKIAPITITDAMVSATDQTYDGTAKTPVVVTDGGKTLVEGIDYTLDYTNNTNVGTASCTVTGKGNYGGTVNTTFAIRMTPNVALAAKTATYTGTPIAMDGAAVTLAGSDVYSGAVTYTYYTNSACTEGKTTTAPTNAGTYYVKASSVTFGNYNAATSEAATLTINKADLSITANAQTITYGGAIAQGVGQVTTTGLGNGESLTGISLTANATDVPGGTITPGAAVLSGSADNYTITYHTGALTINPTQVTALDLSALVTPPAKNAVPVTAIADQPQYTGTVSWNGTPSKFLGGTVYTATVTLAPTANYTFTGVPKDAFTYTGATVTNAAGSGTVAITFPVTATVAAASVVPTGKPAKTEYSIGEAFDPTGLTITVTNDDGTTKVIDQTTGYGDISVSPAVLAADTTSITVSYGGVESATIPVSVRQIMTGITASEYVGTYDGAAHGITLSGVPEGATVKYGTAEGSYDKTTLTYTDVTEGTKTVYYQIIKAGFEPATGSQTVTITPAPLTWDVSGLAAKKIHDGTTAATVTGTLRVGGMSAGDNAQFTCDAPLTGTYADAEIGTGKTVTVSAGTLAAAHAAVANKNYTLPTGPVTLTNGLILGDLTYLPPAEGSTGDKLAISMADGVTGVPDTLKDNEKLNTPDKITEALQAEANAQLPGVPAENITIKDLDFWSQTEGSTGWVPGTPAQFPTEGVKLDLLYSDFGLTYEQAQGMDFTVAQMLTQGGDSGNIVVTDFTLTPKGIHFTLSGPAPVVVAYKLKSAHGHGNGGSETPAPTPTPDSAPGKFTVNVWVNVLAGGTVSPMGYTTYTQGQNLTYTITPASGYRVARVTVDGVDVGAVGSYTFNSLNRSHEIGAYFEKTTGKAGTGGLIPATADETPLMLWLALLALAAIGLCTLVPLRRKK